MKLIIIAVCTIASFLGLSCAQQVHIKNNPSGEKVFIKIKDNEPGNKHEHKKNQ